MDARDKTLALLALKESGRTICPSDVAKALTTDDASCLNWRDNMTEVHGAVDQLLEQGLIRISWKGTTLKKRSGPYRITRNQQG